MCSHTCDDGDAGQRHEQQAHGGNSGQYAQLNGVAGQQCRTQPAPLGLRYTSCPFCTTITPRVTAHASLTHKSGRVLVNLLL